MNDLRADGVRVACPLFHAEGGGSTPTSALQLRFRPIDLPTAKALNRLWHSRLPRLTSPGCRIAYAAEFDGIFYATAVWCRPLAVSLPQGRWLELQRLAIAPDAPRNTASRMLGWMARDVPKRFPSVERLISYQDLESHTGAIYRAAGWMATVLVPGRERTRPGRYRRKVQSTAPKRRWEKRVRDESDQRDSLFPAAGFESEPVVQPSLFADDG